MGKETMSKIGRRLESAGFSMRKTYRKISSAKPSVLLVATVVTAFSIFLLGGGIYDILEQPLVALPVGSRILFFYPGTVQEQFLLDSFYVMISYFFGVLGLMLLYQSTRYAFKPRQAFMLLIVGALFILIAYLSVENLIWAKLSIGIG